MPPSGVDYASEFLNGYAPEYVAGTERKEGIHRNAVVRSVQRSQELPRNGW